MDLRDPLFNKWHGCEDHKVLFRLRPDGGLQKKPPCADCNSRGIEECFDCEDIEECRPKCSTCQFIDMCDGDDFPSPHRDGDLVDAEWPGDLPEVDYLKLKEAQDALDAANVPEDDRIAYPWTMPEEEEIPLTKPLSFHLTEYIIKKIDNGYIITYHIGDDTRQRFVPDPKSIQGFIDQHTD